MKRSKHTALKPLVLPPHQRHTLPNGLVVHVVPRPQLPLVAVRLVINAGGALDGLDQAGLADFSARLFRRGAGGMAGDAISDAVEFVGASLGGYANEENVIVALSTPAAHLESMLKVLAQVTLSPDFPESEWELMRRRTLAQLTNALDDPGELVDRALTQELWGAHPFGVPSEGTVKSLPSLTPDDARRFHQRLGPSIAHLYVVGDVVAQTIVPLVERLFGQWKGGLPTRPSFPNWPGLAQPGRVVIVDKPEQTQVQVRIAAKGVQRGHADHFPLMVMNTVLGGGFTSRLMTQIRVRRGLSYGAGSAWDMMTGSGTFTVHSFTKTESVPTLIEVALDEVAKMKAKGPTPAELATAQRYICGLYPGRLETNESVSSAIADVEHYGLSADWVSEYRQRVMNVTKAQAAAAAKAHLFDSGEFSIVLVGNAKSLEKTVASFGAVAVVQPDQL
jgi:zinc protease